MQELHLIVLNQIYNSKKNYNINVILKITQNVKIN